MNEVAGNPLGVVVNFTPPAMPPLDLILTGRTVRLEPLERSHAIDLEAEFRGHDVLWDYMPSGPFADLAAFSEWVVSRAGKPDPMFVAIIDLATGKAVGVASFMRIVPADGVIEVGGIAFSPALQGTVMATEAMVLMMRWAFEAGYRRYEWKCHSLNAPSRRAAGRLGFSYEGTFRQHMI
ncbi:MAG: GNAT family protein, partial [Deltaproteobacteria bacterium]